MQAHCSPDKNTQEFEWIIPLILEKTPKRVLGYRIGSSRVNH